MKARILSETTRRNHAAGHVEYSRRQTPVDLSGAAKGGNVRFYCLRGSVLTLASFIGQGSGLAREDPVHKECVDKNGGQNNGGTPEREQ
jgi:hypothetical protein